MDIYKIKTTIPIGLEDMIVEKQDDEYAYISRNTYNRYYGVQPDFADDLSLSEVLVGELELVYEIDFGDIIEDDDLLFIFMREGSFKPLTITDNFFEEEELTEWQRKIRDKFTKLDEEEIETKAELEAKANPYRSPKGGITINGVFYRGGQFIPKEVLETLSEEEKEGIKEGKDVGGVDVEEDENPRFEGLEKKEYYEKYLKQDEQKPIGWYRLNDYEFETIEKAIDPQDMWDVIKETYDSKNDNLMRFPLVEGENLNDYYIRMAQFERLGYKKGNPLYSDMLNYQERIFEQTEYKSTFFREAGYEFKRPSSSLSLIEEEVANSIDREWKGDTKDLDEFKDELSSTSLDKFKTWTEDTEFDKPTVINLSDLYDYDHKKSRQNYLKDTKSYFEDYISSAIDNALKEEEKSVKVLGGEKNDLRRWYYANTTLEDREKAFGKDSGLIPADSVEQFKSDPTKYFITGINEPLPKNFEMINKKIDDDADYQSTTYLLAVNDGKNKLYPIGELNTSSYSRNDKEEVDEVLRKDIDNEYWKNIKENESTFDEYKNIVGDFSSLVNSVDTATLETLADPKFDDLRKMFVRYANESNEIKRSLKHIDADWEVGSVNYRSDEHLRFVQNDPKSFIKSLLAYDKEIQQLKNYAEENKEFLDKQEYGFLGSRQSKYDLFSQIGKRYDNQRKRYQEELDEIRDEISKIATRMGEQNEEFGKESDYFVSGQYDKDMEEWETLAKRTEEIEDDMKWLEEFENNEILGIKQAEEKEKEMGFVSDTKKGNWMGRDFFIADRRNAVLNFSNNFDKETKRGNSLRSELEQLANEETPSMESLIEAFDSIENMKNNFLSPLSKLRQITAMEKRSNRYNLYKKGTNELFNQNFPKGIRDMDSTVADATDFYFTQNDFGFLENAKKFLENNRKTWFENFRDNPKQALSDFKKYKEQMYQYTKNTSGLKDLIEKTRSNQIFDYEKTLGIPKSMAWLFEDDYKAIKSRIGTKNTHTKDETDSNGDAWFKNSSTVNMDRVSHQNPLFRSDSTAVDSYNIREEIQRIKFNDLKTKLKEEIEKTRGLFQDKERISEYLLKPENQQIVSHLRQVKPYWNPTTWLQNEEGFDELLTTLERADLKNSYHLQNTSNKSDFTSYLFNTFIHNQNHTKAKRNEIGDIFGKDTPLKNHIEQLNNSQNSLTQKWNNAKNKILETNKDIEIQAYNTRGFSIEQGKMGLARGKGLYPLLRRKLSLDIDNFSGSFETTTSPATDELSDYFQTVSPLPKERQISFGGWKKEKIHDLYHSFGEYNGVDESKYNLYRKDYRGYRVPYDKRKKKKI